MSAFKEEMFVEWLNLAKVRPADHIYQELIAEGGVLAHSDEYIKSKLRSANQLYSEHLIKLSALDLTKKLEKEPGFKRALSGLRGRRSKLILYERTIRTEEGIEKLLKRLRAAKDAAAANIELKYSMRLTTDTTWYFRFVTAFHEYLYTDSAERMYEAQKTGPQQLKRLLTTAAGLDRLVKVLANESVYLDRELTRWKWVMSKLENALDGGAVFEALPIRKNNARKKERLFVYRMYQANKRYTQSPKPSVIVDLMTIDGFQEPFDLRTVQRMFGTFTTAKP